MKRIKRVLIFLFAAVCLLPQGFTNVEAAENAEVKVGDKYQKEIVSLDEEPENTSLDEKMMNTNMRLFSMAFNEDSEKKTDYTETLLVPKTNANYEIALAYENGDYTYVGTADTYDEAVKKAEVENEKVKTVKESFIVPVVLNTSTKSVDYATYGIGRCKKIYEDGKGDSNYRVCNMFKDSKLSTVDRCIHEDRCSEMPLIEERENEAKVYISGYSGWLNKKLSRCAGNLNKRNSKDVVITTLNKVTNPSFYYVDNDGLLYHYISETMDIAEVKIGSWTCENEAKKIGKAPSYLNKRVKYLSYDGQYFYSTQNRGIPETLRILTEDLKCGNFNNSTNSSSPYYNYYLYLPFRSRTNYTAKDLNRYIDYFIDVKSKSDKKYAKSILKGIGDCLIENQNKYGVNALLALSIAINESDGGASPDAINKKNIFGLNSTDYNTGENTDVFHSVEDCVESFCKNYMSRWFTDVTNSSFYGDFLGNKGYGANVKYASDPYWADKAANNACKIENYLTSEKPNGEQPNKDNYKDYDYYQLFKFTGSGSVKDIKGIEKYKVNNEFIPCNGEFVGGIGILLCNNIVNLDGVPHNEIALDMTLGNDKKNNGTYMWSSKGYIAKNSVNKKYIELINKGKTNTDKLDLDKNGHVDTQDLAKEASLYNVSGSNLNYIYDVNDDGIVDIYDLVKISSVLQK